MEKFHRFHESIASPQELLDDPTKRSQLETSLRLLKPDRTFFSMNGEIDSLFNEMSTQGNFYKQWKQKVGKKTRSISVPHDSFEYLLREYVLPFVKSLPTYSACHGGEKGWSPEKSLKTHLPLRSLITFDMKDAFSQATIDYVFGFLYESLEGRLEEDARFTTAGFLASVCTVKTYSNNSIFEVALPQGSLVSMALFNRMMYPIDKALYRAARKKGMKYSRWVDDFTVSSTKRNRFNDFSEVLHTAQQYCSLAPEKIFFSYQGYAYALGHRVNYALIEKLDRSLFEKERGNPISNIEHVSTHSRGEEIYDMHEGGDFLRTLEEQRDDSFLNQKNNDEFF